MSAVLVDYALTNVADVKESLNIASADHTKDNLITRKINQVTDLIEKYCGRRFKLTEYSEYYDGSNIDEITLRNRPIVIDGSHLFTAEFRDTSLNEGDFDTIESQIYFVDESAGIVKLNYRAVGRWNRYRYGYWAGYATIPNDLAEAAATLAAYYVNNPTGAFVGTSLRKEGQREIRYSNTNNTLTFMNIVQQLGLDETINAYANLPLLTEQ